MLSITGVQSQTTDPLQWIRQLSGQSSTTETNRPQGPPPGGGDVPEPLWEDIEASAETAGLSEEDLSALKEELKSAISTAMESVDPSSGPESGHEAIDSAILSTLKENGIDTTDIETHMAEAKERMANMPPPGSEEDSDTQSFDSALLALLSDTTSSSQFSASSLLSSFLPLVDETA